MTLLADRTQLPVHFLIGGAEGETIRRRDGKKGLVESGYAWMEPSRLWMGLAFVCLGLVFVFGLAIWMEVSILSSMRRMDHMALVVLGAGAAGFCVSFMFALTKWHRPLALVFDKDGAIRTPHGDLYKTRTRRWRFPHGEIRSFESKNEGVFVFLADGDVFIVSRAADMWLRHKIVVQLTNALTEIRGANNAKASQSKGGAARSRTAD